MKMKKKWILPVLCSVPVAIYATVLQDDGLNTGGNNTVNDGDSSVAIGSGNTATVKSLAVGENNVVGTSSSNKGRSMAVGIGNSVALGDSSMAVGTSNTIGSYSDSVAMGTGNSVHAGGSFVLGSGNTIYSNGAQDGNILIGRGNGTYFHSTQDCVLLGKDNFAYGNKVWILGEGNSGAAGAVTLGTYSNPEINASLVVGTGSDAQTRSNGLIIYKNGDVIVPKCQGDINMGAFGSGN